MAGILPIISNLDDLAQSIAVPDPTRPIQNAIGSQGRRVCDAISNAPSWATSGVGFLPLAGLFCRPYWDGEGISPPQQNLPFTGGQCAGAAYRIDYRSFRADGTFQQNFLGNFVGPIASINITRISSTNINITVVDANGTSSSNPASNAIFVRYEPLVTRLGGLPDNCGNPAPTGIKPGPNPSPRNPVIPPEEQPVIDPVTGPGLPIPDLPTIPGFPPLELPENPFGNDPEVSLPVKDPVGAPGATVDTGAGGGSGGGEVEGEAPAGQEIVGLKLDLVEALQGSREYGDGIYRGGAYIRMGTAAGLDQDFGGSQIESGQFFFAERDGLTKWRVTANIGYRWNVTPYYREV